MCLQVDIYVICLILKVTPEDYEPPGFKAADCDNFVFEDEPMTIKVGDVSTVSPPFSC